MKKAKRSKGKAKRVQPIPAGYQEVTPYLSIRGAAEAMEFYKKAFGARELMRMPGPEGKLGHAEIRIGASRSGDAQARRGDGGESRELEVPTGSSVPTSA